MLLVGAVVLVGSGHGTAVVNLESGAAWLVAAESGAVVRAEGTSAIPGPPIPVSAGGEDLRPAETPDALFVAVGDSGTVARVDARTTRQTSVRSFGPAGTSLVVVVAAGVVYVVDPGRGTVTEVDPTTLEPRGPLVQVNGPLAGAWPAPDGTVWLASAVDGTFRPVRAGAVGAAVPVAAAHSGVDFLVVDGRPWALDVAGGRLVPLSGGSRETGAVRGLVAPAGEVTATVPLATQTGLVVVDVGTGRARSVELTEQGGGLGAPVRFEDAYYVPDDTTGRVLVVGADDLRPRGPIEVTPDGADLRVFRQGSMLWANDTRSGAAVVVYEGRVRRVGRPAPSRLTATPAGDAPVSQGSPTAVPSAFPPLPPTAPPTPAPSALTPSPTTPPTPAPSSGDPPGSPEGPRGTDRASLPPASRPPADQTDDSSPGPGGSGGSGGPGGPGANGDGADGGGGNEPGKGQETNPRGGTDTDGAGDTTGTVDDQTRPPTLAVKILDGGGLVDVTVDGPTGVDAPDYRLAVSPEAGTSIISDDGSHFQVQVPDCSVRTYTVTSSDPTVPAMQRETAGCEPVGDFKDVRIVVSNGAVDVYFSTDLGGGPIESVCGWESWIQSGTGGSEGSQLGCGSPTDEQMGEYLQWASVGHWRREFHMGLHYTFSLSVSNAAGGAELTETVVLWNPPCSYCAYGHQNPLELLDTPGGTPIGVAIPPVAKNTFGPQVEVQCQVEGNGYSLDGEWDEVILVLPASDSAYSLWRWWNRISYQGSVGYVPAVFVSTPNSRTNTATPEIPQC